MRTKSAGRTDRGVKLNFTFDGKFFTGFQGDTLASALIANGVHLMGRSFKYHRPRGVLGAGAEEPNALVAVDRGGGRYTPNLRATQVELYEGLVATSQNRWPSLGLDLGAVNDLIPIFSAGFYYKTFMHPRTAWKHLYEPVIRRMAGLGKAPTEPDPDQYTHRYAHCDVLVVGAGAAGLKAALDAAAKGGRVILCDEQAEMGGGLLSEPDVTIEGQSALAWVETALTKLRAAPNVTLLSRTQAFGYFAQNFVALSERLTDHLAAPHPDLPRERLWKVRAGEVVLAVGAIERPLVFPNNDRPGVMLASAARALVNRYGVIPGRRAVLFAADDSGYAAARDLAKAGVEIALIADLRYQPSDEAEAARADGFTVQVRTVIANVLGGKRVSGVETATLAIDNEVLPAEKLACDLLLMAGGWTPSVHLFSQSGGKLRFDEAHGVYVPGEPSQNQRSVGACAGLFGIDAATGLAVSGEIAPAGGYVGAVPTTKGATGKAFVDFQNDVTSKDIGLAVSEGFRSIEHIKRYTTNGMATDQGKTSNMNGLAIAAALLDKSIPEVGLTTFRMPYTPVTFGSFAGHARGDLFDPVRRTPTHEWAEA
ncbi:MAG: 2Fe-2S iron-sulfur cluster-binding protein, partial [Elsteraceae bacterium]